MTEFKNLDRFLRDGGTFRIFFDDCEENVKIYIYAQDVCSNVLSGDNLLSALQQVDESLEPTKPKPKKGEWWLMSDGDRVLALDCDEVTARIWHPFCGQVLHRSIEKDFVKKIPAPFKLSLPGVK